jgi:hypothetical protein
MELVRARCTSGVQGTLAQPEAVSEGSWPTLPSSLTAWCTTGHTEGVDRQLSLSPPGSFPHLLIKAVIELKHVGTWNKSIAEHLLTQGFHASSLQPRPTWPGAASMQDRRASSVREGGKGVTVCSAAALVLSATSPARTGDPKAAPVDCSGLPGRARTAACNPDICSRLHAASADTRSSGRHGNLCLRKDHCPLVTSCGMLRLCFTG